MSTNQESTHVTDDASKPETPSPKNSTTNKPNIPQAEIQTPSKMSLPKDPLTSSSSLEKEDADKGTDAGADSQMLKKTPSEDQNTSNHTPSINNGSTSTNKQEADGTAAINEISPPVKTESMSKDSSPTSQAIAAQEPETLDSKKLPLEANSNTSLPEISHADDEALPKHLPPPKVPKSQANETSKEDSTKKSKWKILRNLFWPRKDKVSKSKSQPSTNNQDSKGKDTRDKEREHQISLINADIEYITKRAKELGLYNERLGSILEGASKDFEVLKKEGKLEEFQEFRKDIMKLKLQDPSKYKVDADEEDNFKNLPFRPRSRQRISPEVLSKMPQLHKRDVFETSLEYKDFEARFNKLDNISKRCLLCFSVFPEDIVRKRLLLQWWVSEGFVSDQEEASRKFEELIEKGFVEPVKEKRSRSVGRCRMHSFYRSALVMLAERAKFFNFGPKGEPTQDFLGTFQACLVGDGLISFEDLKLGKLKIEDLEKLHLLINVDEHILDFKPHWFSKMSNLNFLHLGRWKVLDKDHIEVEDTDFLSGLEKMKCVNFLSLQGISNIISLPKSILQMENLNILDIRSCYNLESIPERIDFLKNLTHLDMSECYLLDHMPKSLSLLKELKVIKGFVVGNDVEKNGPCTLGDLEKLPKLIKLCIYTGLKEFPKDQHVEALGKLKELLKLTITWGGSALRTTNDNQADNRNKKHTSTAENGKQKSQGLPSKLEKLDLKCFPQSTTPYWLELESLKNLNLKKLYIRGGELSDLGQYRDIDDCNNDKPAEKVTWKVEVLRLKYLSEIEMEWKQLHKLFPQLTYLEQVSCPKLTLFPCDANGVWIK